jgi:hypothetical protein
VSRAGRPGGRGGRGIVVLLQEVTAVGAYNVSSSGRVGPISGNAGRLRPPWLIAANSQVRILHNAVRNVPIVQGQHIEGDAADACGIADEVRRIYQGLVSLLVMRGDAHEAVVGGSGDHVHLGNSSLCRVAARPHVSLVRRGGLNGQLGREWVRAFVAMLRAANWASIAGSPASVLRRAARPITTSLTLAIVVAVTGLIALVVALVVALVSHCENVEGLCVRVVLVCVPR